ncbi:MAG: hypothetical protein Q7V13_17635 [Phenylobacterium sp.]|uniref:hypothetical protein n=1 Tax=Phenylobacterium sp. TaxID=1871053 RepID=UPI002722C7D5|nr:hypothetical protein [Phenylobacterium sp.]MDO8913656.1 hypothetical protein [Phenylobacterium sp.]
MDMFNDRRIVLALIGGALALMAGLGIAIGMVSKTRNDRDAAPPASQGGLVVETTTADDGGIDPARPLRCFVAGQYVGEVTLAECAKKNGVATGALDVGVDATGALAAADDAGTVLTPLPPVQTAAVEPTLPPAAAATPAAATPAAAPAGSPTGACWRYAGNVWSRLPSDLSLNGCVQALFAGRCERPGGATYGRWMTQTLRLVPGKVEVSGDNRSFRTLADQGGGCAIPSIG